MIDFKLGEAILGESEESFERHIRIVPWFLQDQTVDSTRSNRDWFRSIYQTKKNIVGIMARGTTCKLEVEDVDLFVRLKDGATPIAISSITLAVDSPVRIATTANHNVLDDEVVRFTDIVGTTELNGNKYILTKVSDTEFDLNNTTYDGSNYTAYSSGGNIFMGKKIDACWKAPPYYGEVTTRLKQWLKSMIRSVPKGSWKVNVEVFKDRQDIASKTFEMQQVQSTKLLFDVAQFDISNFSDGSIVRFFNRLNVRSEIIQIRFSTDKALQPFEITNFEYEYYLAAQVN